MHDVPGDALSTRENEATMKDEADPDVRVNQIDDDKMVEHSNEFYDGDKDQDKPNVNSDS